MGPVTEAPQVHLIADPGGSLMGLLQVPQAAKSSLAARQAKIADLLTDELEFIARRLLAAPSDEKFRQIREQIFTKYFRLCRAVSNFLESVADETLIAQFVDEAWSNIERDFLVTGPKHLSGNALHDAIFCVSTLRRIQRLLPRVQSVKPPEDMAVRDKRLEVEFAQALIWSELHLDCLHTAIIRNIRVRPDIESELLAGMRACVTAYALLRESLGLRQKQSLLTEPLELDEEDRSLLRASERDFS